MSLARVFANAISRGQCPCHSRMLRGNAIGQGTGPGKGTEHETRSVPLLRPRPGVGEDEVSLRSSGGQEARLEGWRERLLDRTGQDGGTP